MDNLINIALTNKQLYEKLISYNCVLSKFDKIIFEGNINNAKFEDNENGSQIVCKFNINENKTFICLLNKNEYLNKFYDILENSTLDEALINPITYNKLYNLAYKLPQLNIIKEGKKLSRNDLTYKILLENFIQKNI